MLFNLAKDQSQRGAGVFHGKKARYLFFAVRFLFIGLIFLFSPAFPVRAVDEFGDLSVEPGAIYTGNTFHGYAEIRVTVENHSHTKSHMLTLVYPDRSFYDGNSIGRVSRTAKLEPEEQVVVSLLQPPLPAQGDSQIQVEVDGHTEGSVHAPNANSHCSFYRGGPRTATTFISRSLDYDAVERVFHGRNSAFAAAKAVGPPDAFGSRYQFNSWMPGTRRRGVDIWLELDYATPQVADKIQVYETISAPRTGQIVVIGASGKTIATLPMSAGVAAISTSSTISTTYYTGPGHVGGRSYSEDTVLEYKLSATNEPVKTVRLDYGKALPFNIAVDAVALSGPAGIDWADDAHASSDNSASAGSFVPGGGGVEEVECLRSETAVSDWSDNWLGYSPFDVVVLNSADFSELPQGVLSALGDYLHAGGNIVMAGKTDLPDTWHPSSKTNLVDGIEYEIGFGRCFILDSDIFSTPDSGSLQTLRNAALDSAHYWQDLPEDDVAANSALPVVANLKIPVRGIVFIMLVFIIIIGPVNIIYLTRRGHRTWMLWTIPVISLVTTVIVFTYSLLREGITPNTLITGVTLLDQTSHRAATIGGTAFYCPLTPSGGLQFEYCTEATPLVQSGFGQGNSREVDWTQSQHLQRGWISARVPAHFHLRKSETRRERIQLLNENDKLQVANSLGAPIRRLWFADKDMNIYTADNVAAGEKAELVLSNKPNSREQSGARGLLHDLGYAAQPDSIKDSAGKYLLPNTYIAVLEGNPFVENALGSAASTKRTKSSAVVFGILESPQAQ